MGPDPGPVVIIGLKEIYDAVTELKGTVAMLVHQDRDRAADITDHETRIRVIERGRWPLPSLAVLMSLAALVLEVLSRR